MSFLAGKYLIRGLRDGASSISIILALTSSSRAHLRSLLASARRCAAFIRHVSSSNSGSSVNLRFPFVMSLINYITSDKNRPTVFSALLIPLLLCGCVGQVGKEMSRDKIESIKWGVTTLPEMETMFGKPRDKLFAEAGKMNVTWVYVRVQSFAGVTKNQKLTALINSSNIVESVIVYDQ